MTRVVIADDALPLRQGVSSVLATLDGVEVVAEADDHPSLMRAVAQHRPDLVITDVRMPPTLSNEGIAAAREIRATYPEIGVIVLSQYLDADYVLVGSFLALGEGSSRQVRFDVHIQETATGERVASATER